MSGVATGKVTSLVNEGIRSSHEFLLASVIFGLCWLGLCPGLLRVRARRLQHPSSAVPWVGAQQARVRAVA